MKHTQGPWTADANGLVTAEGQIPICFAESAEGARVANANLIAAAPDLLDALLHMKWCRSCAEGDWQDCDEGREALAAITKATGTETETKPLSCPSGKIPYRSQAEATARAKMLQTCKKRSKQKLCAYQCQDCFKWHLANPRPK